MSLSSPQREVGGRVHAPRPYYRLGILIVGVIVAFEVATVSAAVDEPGIESTYAEHTRGVELARAGRHEEGLAVLRPLLARFPNDYPLQRDIVLITIWKGDCPGALERFARIRDRPNLEPYLVVPVGHCLLAANRPKEARRLARLTLLRHPGAADLQNLLLEADLVLRVDENIDEDRTAATANLEMQESELNLPEWIGYFEGSTKVAERTRLYARYRFTRAIEDQFVSGDMDRVGVGVRYRFDERLVLDQEFSTDVRDAGQNGATTRLTFEPRDDWRHSLTYASFSEDVPLRARAAGIDARQWSAESAYESRDYRWDGALSLNYYDFSDTNQRTNLSVYGGYAYEMRANREQRIYLEWYQSRNTLDGAAYYNPARDYSLGLTHRTDFIFESRFKRHVDHLSVGVNAYGEQGYGTYGRWALGYWQDYDFDEDNALTAGAGVARNVYDGKYETEWRLYLYYHHRF